MSAPVLVGMVRLPFPMQLARTPEYSEWVQNVAFDQEGRAWALVFRTIEEPVRKMEGLSVSCTQYVFNRWQLATAIPFSTDPVLQSFPMEQPLPPSQAFKVHSDLIGANRFFAGKDPDDA